MMTSLAWIVWLTGLSVYYGSRSPTNTAKAPATSAVEGGRPSPIERDPQPSVWNLGIFKSYASYATSGRPPRPPPPIAKSARQPAEN